MLGLRMIPGDGVRQGILVVVEEPGRGPPEAVHSVDEPALSNDSANELDRKRSVVGICGHDTV